MITLRNIFVLIFLFFCLGSLQASALQTLTSPDKNITVEISLKGKIYYTVSFKGERVLEASPLSLTLESAVLGENPKVTGSKLTTVDEKISTVWGSRKEIHDHYNQLSVTQRKGNHGFKN